MPAGDDEVAADTLVALFALSATPEDDNHGAFIASLSARSGAGSPPAAIVDESGFRTRFAQQPQRIDERREAWRRVLAAQHVEPVFVDLGAPDAADAAAALDAALHRRVPA